MIIWHETRNETDLIAEWIADAMPGSRILTDLVQMQADLENDPEESALILAVPPTVAITRSLGFGLEPLEALKIWKRDAAELIDLRRRNRRRIKIIDSNAAASYPRQLARLLEISRDDFEESCPGMEYAADPVFQLLSKQTLRENVVALTLAEELEASMEDLSGGAPPPSVSAQLVFFNYLETRKKSEGFEAELGHLRMLLDLQEQQNAAMADELDAVFNARNRLEQRLEQITAGLESFQEQNASLEDRVRRQETSLSQKDLEIESLSRKMRDLFVQSELNGEEKEALQRELDRILNSRSIRVTAPLRWFGNVLRHIRGNSA